jgi:hypothetical protein
MSLTHGLQKTLILADKRTKDNILKYIPEWVATCEKLIQISLEIYNLTQGKRCKTFWLTTKNERLTYGELFTKILDIDEELSKTNTGDWVFRNIMQITENGNWELQNNLNTEFIGARFLEFSSDTNKMDQFLRRQKNLK